MDASEQLRPFVPRLIYDWVRRFPDRHALEVEGTLAFIDISGFTSLTERLARKGRIGAEEMNDVLNDLFGELIPVAYDDGAGLVKWGGDAALLLFDGDQHAARACRAAINMQRTIRTAGRLQTSAGQVRLRMSIGINSGSFNLFLVGDPAIHRELVIAGPASTGTVLMEQTAEAGEVVVSASTAAMIDPAALGAAKGEGVVLRRAPEARSHPAQPRPDVTGVDLRTFVPAAVRDYLLEEGHAQPEHRRITAAFIEFTGTDRLLAAEGPEAAAAAIDECVRVVQTAALRDGVGFFESDVSRDAFRIMLIVGAPQSAGDDEGRMLATLRTVLEASLRLPPRIGANAGHVFSAYFGPPFRKTYSVKGDAVNLAARLMAKAPPGELYTTAEVLDHSMTLFDVTALEPFLVKGKREPARAWSVGARVGVRDLREGTRSYPLWGREKEFAEIIGALAEVRRGHARTIELVGESGIGKTRLVDELRREADDLRQVGAVGEAYTAATPYVAWRSVLRELFGLSWEDTSDVIVQRLREIAAVFDPERTPWLPLIATATDADMEPTPEVRDLDPAYLRPRLHESVVAFLRAVQPGPTLFVFENAHLMDEASADLLSAICRAEADLPWLIVVSRRPEDEGFRAPDAPGVRRLEIGPIDRDAALALAHAATDEAPLPAHVIGAAVDRSGGNPQFLLDLASSSAAGDELPASVETAAVVRIDRLPPSTRDLVRRASVFGLAFHPRFFDDVLDEGMPRPDASTWTGLAEFFEEEDDGYLRFRRAVVRDAAYAGLPFRIRQRVHAAAGRLFEEMVEDPDESAGLLSLHFSAAGEWAKAYRYATASAAHAARINAPIEAGRLYRRAIDAGRRSGADAEALAGLWERLGDVLRLAGLFVDAKRAYAEAIGRCDADVARARLMLKRSIIEENMGRFPQMLRWLSKARKQIGDDRSSDAGTQLARIDARYAGGLQAEGRNVEAIRMAAAALSEAEAAGSNEAAAEAHNILGMANVMLGRPGSTEHWQAALGIFEELDDLNGQAMISLNLGGGAYFEGRWTDALARFERAREMYERLGRPVDVTLARMNVAEILADQGWYEEAKSSLRDAVRVWRAAEDRYSLGFCLSYLGRIDARRGRLDEAHAAFAQAREEFLYVGAQGDALEVDVREAECLLYEGRPADALALVDDVFARSEEPGAGTLAPMLLRIRGYGLLAQGDAEGAARAFDASLEGGRDQGADHEVAFTLQAWVRLSRRIGAEPDPSMVQESGRLLGRLGIIAVPAFPL